MKILPSSFSTVHETVALIILTSLGIERLLVSSQLRPLGHPPNQQRGQAQGIEQLAVVDLVNAKVGNENKERIAKTSKILDQIIFCSFSFFLILIQIIVDILTLIFFYYNFLTLKKIMLN
jgi:hypothetical protein